MIKRWLQAVIDKFGRRYDYDASYMKDLVDLDSAGAMKLALASPFLLHRFGAPKDVYFAAKLRSVMRADCGPCLQLVTKMAQEAGAGSATLLTALGKGTGSPEVALAVRFADAVIDDAPDLPEVMEEVRARFGKGVQAGLAAAVVAGHFYPLLKRGLGHAQSCAPVMGTLLALQAREERQHVAG